MVKEARAGSMASALPSAEQTTASDSDPCPNQTQKEYFICHLCVDSVLSVLIEFCFRNLRLPTFQDDPSHHRIKFLWYLQPPILETNRSYYLHWVHSSPWQSQCR